MTPLGITGTVTLDLAAVSEPRRRHAANSLREAPDGARVRLVVGALPVCLESLPVLREHVGRLAFDVHGDPTAVRVWIRALRTGRIAETGGVAW